MSGRRTHPRLTPERRQEKPPQWKGKPIVAPLVALAIALWPAKHTVVLDPGKSVTVSTKGKMADCWYDVAYKGIVRVSHFCATHTTDRR